MFSYHYRCVGGIVVSIAAFQAVDPGSIPGQRKDVFHFLFNEVQQRTDMDPKHYKKNKNKLQVKYIAFICW